MSSAVKNLNINVHHITRVEGHGNIAVNIKDGVLEECALHIVESPRFFESFVRGRSYKEAALITCRICGICSPGHQLTSLKATESAMGINISKQTRLLRELLIDGATLQSHILHVYFLVAPDLFGVPSVIPLAESNPDIVKRALRLKRLANDICEVVNGLAVHGVRMVPGWVTMLPTVQELRDLKERCKEAHKDIGDTVEILKSVADKIPPLKRETEYISLRSKNDFALYDGDIFSSDSGATSVSDYLKMTNEEVVRHSTGKHTHTNTGSYMVGALARCNNNEDRLNETGQSIAKELGFKSPCSNPYFNSIAQVIECGHVVQHAIETIDALFGMGLKEEKRPDIKAKSGRGIGATEVPRGILYHDYSYDDNGIIVDANCIIPTNQNFANIDNDMKKFVPEMIEMGWDKEQITQGLEMLVRAYDPCISCSVHALKVKFIE